LTETRGSNVFYPCVDMMHVLESPF